MSEFIKQEHSEDDGLSSSSLQNHVVRRPAQRSRRRFWVVSAIVASGVLVLAIIAFVAVRSFSTPATGPVSGQPRVAPTVTALQYYLTIKNQEYAKAYTYWSTSSSEIKTQDQFIQALRLLDQANGKVTSYSIASQLRPADNQTSTVTLNVTRGNGVSSRIELHLRRVGNEWRIFSSSPQFA
ncbi:MAG: hypothetical protein IMW89_12110 [Ktedonobacteraceae bacterium]|nr:hypothetical protein [Ktedonobacteraceae bacterium]